MTVDVKKSSIWPKHGDKMRFELEWRIVAMTVETLLEQGFTLSIDHDGDNDGPIPITACDMAAMEELFACDEETLYVDGHGARKFVRFIYGNSGWDVISDYGVSLEDALKTVNAFAAEYA